LNRFGSPEIAGALDDVSEVAGVTPSPARFLSRGQ
jgi:hypothetical protein